MTSRFKRLRLSLVLLPGALMVGCAIPAPTIQEGPNAEVSFDGLHKVDHSRADMAWARPDINLAKYNKLWLVSSGFEYREEDINMARTTTERSRGGPYYIDEDRRAEFESEVHEVFVEELAKIENFSFANEAGPDVLMVHGALLDVITFAADDDDYVGRSDVFITSVGEATLLLELRDSVSNTILARSIDRRAAERMGGQMMRSNSVNNRAEVRRLIRAWASGLREGLDGWVNVQNANAGSR